MTKHIIVDGSNIATEGRSEPSLAQLDEAVTALIAEYKNAKVTVIVDATFGHRIAKKERAEFDKALANNELVTPPAGAVGRGDAFILAIADKVKASICSNDSFQEFHGKYKWLFDEGRLIGGKPVPLVGWVFVERLPVRGPTSRRSVKQGGVVAKALPTASPEASKPMPVPKTPPPNARMAKPAPAKQPAVKQPAAARPSTAMANDLVSYLEFVEKHPVGTKVKAVVESYAANGVTVRIGEVAGYVPLKNIASPIPRSAREVFKIGDNVTLMVVGYTASRRSVDLGVPSVVADAVAASGAGTKKSPAKKSVASKSAAGKAVPKKEPAKKSAAKKESAKKVAAKKATVATAKKSASTTATATKKAATKKAAPAKKSASTSSATKKAVPAKKSVAKKK